MDVEARIEQALDRIRPALQADGGDVEFVDFAADRGLLRLRLLGACGGCSLSMVTMKYGVERLLRQAVPEVRAVETVSA